jgi:hypothetical protein
MGRIYLKPGETVSGICSWYSVTLFVGVFSFMMWWVVNIFADYVDRYTAYDSQQVTVALTNKYIIPKRVYITYYYIGKTMHLRYNNIPEQYRLVWGYKDYIVTYGAEKEEYEGYRVGDTKGATLSLTYFKNKLIDYDITF